MATFIALKQIQSGSALEAAAEVGSDFSQSVIAIVSSSLVAVLPDGIVSSSAQVEFDEIIGVTDFSSSIHSTRTALISQVAAVYTALDARVDDLEIFSSSLNSTYATDYELGVTTSVMDSGEF